MVVLSLFAGPEGPRSRSANQLPATDLAHAERYDSRDGEPTRECADVKASLNPLRLLDGRTPAAEFEPKKLQAVREHMNREQDSGPKVTHARVNRVRRFFQRRPAEELVPPSVFGGLRAVDGLRYGRTDARDTEPMRPVPDADAEVPLPFLPPPVAATARVQRLTGVRPGVVVPMWPGDLDRSKEVGVYTPERHKNSWRGQNRTVPPGPKPKRCWSRSSTAAPPETPCFSPKEAEAWRYAENPHWSD